MSPLQEQNASGSVKMKILTINYLNIYSIHLDFTFFWIRHHHNLFIIKFHNTFFVANCCKFCLMFPFINRLQAHRNVLKRLFINQEHTFPSETTILDGLKLFG